MELLLFDACDDSKPSPVIELDRRTNRTYHYWHMFVPGIAAGQNYAYRVRGPFAPERGLRFDPDKVLLDPYGKCVARPAGYSREAARTGRQRRQAMKSVVADPAPTIGKATPLRAGPSPRRLFMRCTWAASPGIPVPVSPRQKGAPMPD